MNDLQKADNKLPIIPPDPTSIGISVAMDTLREALNAGVEIARTRELGRVQRTAILADKEVRITQISEEIKRGMANDRLHHEQKMELISIVRDLLVPNASSITPEISSAAKILLETLKEY